MGRSKKVWGPYKDKTGKPMLKNGYSLVIGANDHFVGMGTVRRLSGMMPDKTGFCIMVFQDQLRRTDVFCCWTRSSGTKKVGLT